MLNAFDAPAARVPPTRVARVVINPGTPLEAKKRAGKVVTSKSSTTRSFINATYGEIRDFLASLVTPVPYSRY